MTDQRIGTCPTCQQPIVVGEATQWTEAGLVHDECAGPQEPEAA